MTDDRLSCKSKHASDTQAAALQVVEIGSMKYAGDMNATLTIHLDSEVLEGVKVIVTRNKQDFSPCWIPVQSPEEYLAWFENQASD